MKEKMMTFIQKKIFLIVVLMVLSCLASAESLKCFEDPDQDGFYSPDAKEIVVDSKLMCWWKKGVLKDSNRNKDCDPNDPKTHLQAIELMDGKDNNCDGVIDEPRFIYSKKIPSSKKSPAINQLKIKISDRYTHNRLKNNFQAYVKILFSPLNGERSFVYPVRGETIVLVKSDYNVSKNMITLANNFTHSELSRFSAYKVVASFYESATSRKSYLKTPVHYVITGGESNNKLTALETYRLKMGLNGLVQVGDSNLGKIGVNGTVDPDGTRFNQWRGRTWCDQFWTWLAIEASDGKGFNDINSDNVPGYFRDPMRDGMWDVNHHDPKQRVVGVDNRYFDDGRGKWGHVLYDPIESDPKNGALGDMLLGPSHVFMFFSADKVNNRIYTIEGNVGNRAVVRKIKIHNELPDPYVYPQRNQGPKRNYIVGLGKLQRYMFTQN
jgi:hypothetical protein